MSRSRHKTKKSRLRHSLFIWHRYIGISVAAIVLLLSLTGLMLNHTETFKLDEKRIQSDLLLNAYGLKLSPPETAFPLGKRWISQIEDHIYLDLLPLSFRQTSPLVGVTETDGIIAIAFSNEIVLITTEGGLIERITPALGLPSKIEKIGANKANQPTIISPKGVFYSDDGVLSWKILANQTVEWSSEAGMPSELSNKVARSFRQETIPVERFILDIHSGRFFGSIGVFIVDFATLMFIFLAFSGFILWLRQKRQQRRKK